MRGFPVVVQGWWARGKSIRVNGLVAFDFPCSFGESFFKPGAAPGHHDPSCRIAGSFPGPHGRSFLRFAFFTAEFMQDAHLS